MGLDKIGMLLQEIIDTSTFSRYLVKNWIYKNKVNVLDFSYYGVNFALELKVNRSLFSVIIVDRNSNICRNYFSEDSKHHEFLYDVSEKDLKKILEMLLGVVLDRLRRNDKRLLSNQLKKIVDENLVYKKLLGNFSKNIDYNFRKWFSSEEIIKRATEITKSKSNYNGQIYKKKFRDRPQVFSGLTREQSFLLELNCLSKLNKTRGDKMDHFPRLVSFDSSECTITTSLNGVSLDKLKNVVVTSNIVFQCQTIVNTLRESNVIHLDDHHTGKNIVINEQGIISLIDFDIAIVDGIATSAFFEPMFEKFNARGGYDGFLERMLNIINTNQYIKTNI